MSFIYFSRCVIILLGEKLKKKSSPEGGLRISCATFFFFFFLRENPCDDMLGCLCRCINLHQCAALLLVSYGFFFSGRDVMVFTRNCCAFFLWLYGCFLVASEVENTWELGCVKRFVLKGIYFAFLNYEFFRLKRSFHYRLSEIM